MTGTERLVAATPARRAARLILILSAFLLPALSLIPLGGMYLWEKGWMLWWAIGALVVVAVAMLLQRSLLSQAAQVEQTSAAEAEGSAAAEFGSTAERFESAAERQAWFDVRAIATGVDISRLDSADAILELGQRTLDAVARRLHPEKHDAVWRFTLPQALAISERVSARLGGFVDTRIPFGDRLTVAQLLSIYGWRRYIGVAEQAYDVWRVIRMANPVTAVTQEARERLSRALVTWGKEHVSRRIAEAYVEEVGRAAIDLYGGRLPTGGGRDVTAEGTASPAADDESSAPVIPGALSVLVVGSSGNRMPLFRDLQREITRRGGTDAPFADLRVSTTDAIAARGFSRRRLMRAASAADVVVWAVTEAGGPSEGDAAALAELRRRFGSAGAVPPPGMVVVVIGAMVGAANGPSPYLGALARGFGGGGHLGEVEPVRSERLAVGDPLGDADLDRLVASIGAAARAVQAARSRSRRYVESERGVWSSLGQAASAVGGLAGALLKPRNDRRNP